MLFLGNLAACSTGTVTLNTTAIGRQLITAISWALVVLMPALVLILFVRRLGGAFDRPLGGLAIVAVALSLAGVTLLTRRLLLSTQYLVLSTESPIRFGIFSAVAVLFLASLTLPGTPTTGIAFAWLVLITGEVAQGLFYFRPELWRQWIARPATDTASISNSVANEAEIPAGLVQQVTRVRDGDLESLHALVRAEIPAGDRLAVLHLSFCPPLAGTPELTAHAVDADTAEVRVTQAETFGARIEVRLPREDLEPRGVMVEVLGTVANEKGSGVDCD